MEYYQKSRAKVIEELGGGCTSCRTTSGLEIHHVVQTISGRGRGSNQRLADWRRNMDKIKLLCKDCHKIEHKGDKK